MPAQKHILAIALTNQCPLRCSFCCVPPGKGDLELETVTRLVEEACASNRIEMIGFTGGEPLLRTKELFAAANIIDQRVKWGVTTGLGWTNKPQVAVEMANMLVNHGISSITISYDPSHESQSRFDIIKAFASEILSKGPTVEFSVTLYEDEISEFCLDNLENEFEKYLISGQCRIAKHYVAPVGNAASSTNCNKRVLSLSNAKCPMKEKLTISVWPNGNVYPCCSTYIVNKENDLIVGNIKELHLNEIIERLETDLYYKTIRELGFSEMILATKENKMWVEIFSSLPIDSCHLCQKIGENKGSMNFLRKEMLKLYFEEVSNSI